MSTRATFAGAEAGIGVIVLSVFALFGIIGFALVILLVAMQQFPHDAGTLASVAGFGVVLAWWMRSLGGDLRRVRVIERTDDGTWILKGPLGLRRGTIAADAPRDVTVAEETAWILIGTARKYKRTYAVITSGTRTWKTAMNPTAAQRPAIDTVRGWMT